MTLTIRPAVTADLDAVIEFLEGAGLPVADLTAERLALVAEIDDKFCGVIGLEAFGDVALLRSLFVAADVRRGGIGPALITAVEVLCIADGVCDLWLLTIDADRFFARLGYRQRDRADTPDAIRMTEEFSGLCPGDAVLMSKKLN